MILCLVAFIIAWFWLMWETEGLSVDLMGIVPVTEIDFSPLMQLAMGMVYLAVGFVLFGAWYIPRHVPRGIKNRMVVLVSPLGKQYPMAVAQAERICRKRKYGWRWQLCV